MIAANIAPGMSRTFLAQTWNNLVPMQLWNDSFEEAKELVTTDIETNIQGRTLTGRLSVQPVTMQSVPVWII